MKCFHSTATIAALLVATALSAPAHASTISVGACVPAAFGTACAPAQIATGPSPLLSLPASTVGGFDISGSATSGVGPTSAVFNSQALQVSTSGAGGLVDIYFTVTGVPSEMLPLNFVSSFTSNQQNATTHQVRESTYEDNTDTAFGLQHQLATALLTNAVLQTAGPFSTPLTPGSPVSFTELYQVELEGCGTQPSAVCTGNLTIDLSASAVPEPATLALFGAGLLGLVAVRRARHP